MTEPSLLPRPKKSWGQNFLIDPNIRRKILDAAEIVPGERIVEIGPGRGMLTEGLLERGGEVTAIEIDPLLAKGLREEGAFDAAARSRLHLIHADALQYPYEEIAAPYKIVANLPYNLSTPLLFRFLKERARISRMVLMLQREVADRLAAPVGGKSYGALSVLIQVAMDVRIAFTVPRGCFRPRPKVDSAVIVVIPLPAFRVPIRDEALFQRVVKGAFGHRRKQIVNALVDAQFQRPTIDRALQKMGLDPRRRGETFTLAEFARLADLLFDSEHGL